LTQCQKALISRRLGGAIAEPNKPEILGEYWVPLRRTQPTLEMCQAIRTIDQQVAISKANTFGIPTRGGTMRLEILLRCRQSL
ncbi:MAG: hypothetical protein ACHWZW_09065, partial [Spirulina sp.]